MAGYEDIVAMQQASIVQALKNTVILCVSIVFVGLTLFYMMIKSAQRVAKIYLNVRDKYPTLYNEIGKPSTNTWAVSFPAFFKLSKISLSQYADLANDIRFVRLVRYTLYALSFLMILVGVAATIKILYFW
jgi:hypothetical protein